MTSMATRMRDAGRSWTDIAEVLHVTVAEAKSMVIEDKEQRRKRLSESQVAEDRNGLRDKCNCTHERKAHVDHEGACVICVLEPCEAFEEPRVLPWRRNDPSVTRVYDKHGRLKYRRVEKVEVDPNIRLHDHVAVQAYQLGVSDDRTRADIPRASLVVKVRRARKRLKAGKKVFKRVDRLTW